MPLQTIESCRCLCTSRLIANEGAFFSLPCACANASLWWHPYFSAKGPTSHYLIYKGDPALKMTMPNYPTCRGDQLDLKVYLGTNHFRLDVEH